MSETGPAQIEEYFNLGLECFHSGSSSSVNVTRQVADKSITFLFAREELVAIMEPALHHLPAGTASPDLRIYCWDQKHANKALPVFPKLASHLNGRGDVIHLNQGDYQACYQPGAQVLSLFDRKLNVAWCWARDFSIIPQYVRSAPFFAIFAWWANQHHMQLLHAAAIGHDTGGLIIAGASGQGKSSTATSCLGSALKFASDDYCLLDHRGASTVHSLYTSAKFEREHAQSLAQLPAENDHPGKLDTEKSLYFYARDKEECLIGRFALHGIVIPEITSDTSPSLKPISSAQALLHLAPSTILQIPGAGQEQFSTLAQLTKSHPAYSLSLGRDMSQVPELLQSVLV